jgi:hypothetical protein
LPEKAKSASNHEQANGSADPHSSAEAVHLLIHPAMAGPFNDCELKKGTVVTRRGPSSAPL